MRVAPINPHANVCRLEIELEWDVVAALYAAAPAALAAIGTALRDRKEEVERRKQSNALLDAEIAENKAKWAALAEACEAEIRRRSNGPSAGRGLIKVLAAEHGVTAEFLNTVLRLHRKEQRAAIKAARLSVSGQISSRSRTRARQIARLDAAGLNQREIAAKVGISVRAVRMYLSDLRKART